MEEDVALIEVWNKIDLLDKDYRAKLLSEEQGEGPVALSAVTGEGIDHLSARVDSFMARHDDILSVRIPVAEGALIAKLYQMAEVLERSDGEEYVIAEVRVSDKQRGPFRDLFGKFAFDPSE